MLINNTHAQLPLSFLQLCIYMAQISTVHQTSLRLKDRTLDLGNTQAIARFDSPPGEFS
jgi:hypothetical protein